MNEQHITPQQEAPRPPQDERPAPLTADELRQLNENQRMTITALAKSNQQLQSALETEREIVRHIGNWLRRLYAVMCPAVPAYSLTDTQVKVDMAVRTLSARENTLRESARRDAEEYERKLAAAECKYAELESAHEGCKTLADQCRRALEAADRSETALRFVYLKLCGDTVPQTLNDLVSAVRTAARFVGRSSVVSQAVNTVRATYQYFTGRRADGALADLCTAVNQAIEGNTDQTLTPVGGATKQEAKALLERIRKLESRLRRCGMRRRDCEAVLSMYGLQVERHRAPEDDSPPAVHIEHADDERGLREALALAQQYLNEHRANEGKLRRALQDRTMERDLAYRKNDEVRNELERQRKYAQDALDNAARYRNRQVKIMEAIYSAAQTLNKAQRYAQSGHGGTGGVVELVAALVSAVATAGRTLNAVAGGLNVPQSAYLSAQQVRTLSQELCSDAAGTAPRAAQPKTFSGSAP